MQRTHYTTYYILHYSGNTSPIFTSVRWMRLGYGVVHSCLNSLGYCSTEPRVPPPQVGVLEFSCPLSFILFVIAAAPLFVSAPAWADDFLLSGKLLSWVCQRLKYVESGGDFLSVFCLSFQCWVYEVSLARV